MGVFKNHNSSVLRRLDRAITAMIAGPGFHCGGYSGGAGVQTHNTAHVNNTKYPLFQPLVSTERLTCHICGLHGDVVADL